VSRETSPASDINGVNQMAQDGAAVVAQMRAVRWTMRGEGPPRKLPVGAAVGVAAWQEGETIAEMFARADADMYKEKKAVGRSSTPA
jgi:GGDEF domain-containing protein